MEGEPVNALVSQLIRRRDIYKGKLKKLGNAIAPGKKITTTTGAKLVMVPKTSGAKTSIPIVKVPSSGQVVTRVNKLHPRPQ